MAMDQQASLKRCRQMAASGAMPASLAAEFTLGEDAALCIIADKCRVHGLCDLSNDAIAARAGGHRTTVQSALRMQLGNGERRRLVDLWLTATFGFKDRYSDREIEAVCKE